MEYHGEIRNGQLMLSDTQNQLRERLLASMKNGTRIKEVLTREGTAKGHQQVKTIFGLAVEMVRQRLYEMRVDVCGVPVNKEMVYDILKKACFGVGDMGETLGLSKMTMAQAAQAFKNCQAWCAVELQLVIPDPDPNWNKEKREKQMKKEDTYNENQ